MVEAVVAGLSVLILWGLIVNVKKELVHGAVKLAVWRLRDLPVEQLKELKTTWLAEIDDLYECGRSLKAAQFATSLLFSTSALRREVVGSEEARIKAGVLRKSIAAALALATLVTLGGLLIEAIGLMFAAVVLSVICLAGLSIARRVREGASHLYIVIIAVASSFVYIVVANGIPAAFFLGALALVQTLVLSGLLKIVFRPSREL